MKWKLQKTGNEDISEILWDWFVSVSAGNLPISGSMVQQHAKEVAEKSRESDF
jgi:hypothetical protein